MQRIANPSTSVRFRLAPPMPSGWIERNPRSYGRRELRACILNDTIANPMAKSKTRRWDATEHLTSDEDMAAYLEAALEEGDPALVSAALGDIARAKGMTEIARETGLGRESLYKALSPEGNPELSTVLKVAKALGLRLHAAAGIKWSKRDAEVFLRGLANPPEPSAALKRAAARYRKRRA